MSDSTVVRTRFAPSPTGFMHIGNLRTGLYSYLYAKKHNGTFVLRIEDTDRERYVEGAVEMIYSTLAKAKIDYDEGPEKDGGYGPYIQSERKAIYKKYAEELVAAGKAYYCFCDKERLESLTDENGVRTYDKHCRYLSKEEIDEKLKSGAPYVVRFKVPENVVSSYTDLVFGDISVATEDLEDIILLKSDGMPTYNFANVIDDHTMNITHILRGVEYLSTTPLYNLIYDAFGWQRPTYIHLSPIMKDAQRKLSKRYGDANFEDFVKRGFLPEAIVNYIALLGWCPKDNTEKMTMDEMVEKFDIDGISKSPSIFDETKMRWLNGEYLKEMPFEQYYEMAKPYIAKAELKGNYDTREIAILMQTRTEIFDDIPEKIAFLDNFGDYDLEWYNHKKMKVDLEVAKKCIEAWLKEIPNTAWDEESIKASMGIAAEKEGIKAGQVMFTVRLAMTGTQITPGGAVEMAIILGKEESVRRLNASLEMINKAL